MGSLRLNDIEMRIRSFLVPYSDWYCVLSLLLNRWKFLTIYVASSLILLLHFCFIQFIKLTLVTRRGFNFAQFYSQSWIRPKQWFTRRWVHAKRKIVSKEGSGGTISYHKCNSVINFLIAWTSPLIWFTWSLVEFYWNKVSVVTMAVRVVDTSNKLIVGRQLRKMTDDAC